MVEDSLGAVHCRLEYEKLSYLASAVGQWSNFVKLTIVVLRWSLIEETPGFPMVLVPRPYSSGKVPRSVLKVRLFVLVS